MTRATLRVALPVALLVSCQPTGDSLHRLFDEYFEDFLRQNPEAATSMGRRDHGERWRDWSRPARAAWAERLEGYLGRLERFDPQALDRQDRLSRELLQRGIRDELDGLRLAALLTRLSQLGGFHTQVLLTLREMPARSEADYRRILARLEGVPAYVDQNLAALRQGMGEGVAQPALVVRRVIGQLDRQSAPPAAESPMLAAFRDYPDTFGTELREELSDAAGRAYADGFQPAWRRLRAFLADEYLEAARPELAVTSLPGGEGAYRYFVRLHTSLPLDPAEVHQIGLREVERIDSAMRSIADQAGFGGDSERYERHLSTDPAQLFASRTAMLAYHRDLALRALPELPRFFRRLPRHAFGIRAIPPDREAGTASNYNPPAADGSRAGWFNLNTYRAERQWRFDKPALVLHETVPGHHLQIAMQRELDGLPEFRRMYRSTAYIEGWALYAETLGAELGVYDDLPSRFGALESERFRARRLVVDTGLHAMGWTRRRAIDYLGDESEVDRYIAWPGQALAYKIGQLKILELKEAARTAHGERFDIRDFHAAVLGDGPLPLEMLEEQVMRYVESDAGGGP